MMNTIEAVVQRIKTETEDHLLYYLDQQLDIERAHFIELITQINATTYDPQEVSEERMTATAERKVQIKRIVDQQWKQPDYESNVVLFKPFYEKNISLLEEVQDVITEEQSVDRYKPKSGDTLLDKLIKLSKNIALKITSAPTKFLNIFRKNKQPESRWNQYIPFRKLVTHHFHARLIEELKQIAEIYFKNIIAEYQILKKIEEAGGVYDVAQLNERIQLIRVELRSKADTLISETVQAFEQDYAIAGTLEFRKKLKPCSKTELAHSDQNKWLQPWNQWNNTVYAFMEEWRADLELVRIKFIAEAELVSFRAAQAKKLVDFIDPDITAINDFITQKIAELDLAEVDEFSKNLKKIHYQAKKKLDLELIPMLTEKLSGQQIVNLVVKMEQMIRKSIESLTEDRIIVNDSQYDQPIRQEELKSISLNELITFEILDNFEDSIASVKKDIFSALTKITSAIQDLDHVVLFSITSAISLVEENKEATEEAANTAKDGLNRAINRLKESRDELETALGHTNEAMNSIMHRFKEKVLELTVDENIRELRLRTLTAKTKFQAEAMQSNLVDKLIVTRDQAKVMFLEWKKVVSEKYDYLSSRFILTASKPALSREVSDYLLDSQLAFERLPLVYKKLFHIEPLSDLALFEGRESELTSLTNAYNRWLSGNYGATAITGEKWSGLTTFLNYAIKNGKYVFPILRHSFTRNTYRTQEMLDALALALKLEGEHSKENVIAQLNQGSRKVVVIEDLQNLYLRRIDGFDALKCLFEIIAGTRQNIFWVCSCTTYAWEFLAKTINIDEFFSYHIPMNILSDQQLVNIIWKRNRISGYNVQFEPTPKREEDKKFLRLESEQQQEVLKSDFFQYLTDFAKSNISMALIYWLLSTREITEDTIKVRSMDHIDVNFLKGLSAHKVQLLHALVLHDGLDDSQLSQVLNMTRGATSLTLFSLLEDGILTRKDDHYWVNPILYRNTISLLKSKNLLH